MIQWELPAVLWGVAAVAALGVVLLRLLGSRRAALERFADAGLIDRLIARLDAGRRRTRLALRIAALALLVLAVAGPRWGFQWQEVRREGIDLIIALDTSRSMLATDVAPNRLERAKLAVLDLVERLNGDRVGLVAFAGSAFLECPLTLDYEAFARSLRALKVGIIPRGGTALGRALNTALQSFDAREGKYQALVLITDGEDHEGDVAEASKRVAAAAVKVYTVGIGTSEGELLPAEGDGAGGFFKDRQGRVVKSRLDEETLETIARDTGGAYVRGLGPSLGLGEVFDEHIAKMERRDIGTRLERRWEPRFQIPLALALLLLLVETGLGDARGPRRLRVPFGGRARSRAATVALLLAAGSLLHAPAAWAAKPAVEGYRSYEQRRYDDAVTRWREALLDEPDSRLLRFNLGAALYRDGKFDEAAQSFASVVAAGDPQFKASAAYNWGNSLYRQGDSLAQSKPQEALKTWEQALGAYASAMAADPADTDPKFGFELTSKRLRELREKLAEEQKQKEQQQQEQQQQGEQDQQQQDQQQQDGQQQAQQQQSGEQNGQPQSGEHNSDKQQAGESRNQTNSNQTNRQPNEQQAGEQQAGGDKQGEQPEQQPDAAEQQAEQQDADGQKSGEQAGALGQPADDAGQNGGEAVASEASDDKDLDRAAARAVLDTARREELGPGDIRRPTTGAALAEPAEDW